jgi:opacity protein-like surface antigen
LLLFRAIFALGPRHEYNLSGPENTDEGVIQMRKSILASAAALAALVSFSASAADNGFYLGGSLGQSEIEAKDRIYDPVLDIDQRVKYKSDQTGYKLIAGWRFIDWMSVEANWVDFGDGSDRINVFGGDNDKVKVKSSVDGWTLSALGFVPIGPVDLFARVGAFGWDASFKTGNLYDNARSSDDGVDLTYGIGAQFRVWSLSIRAEYEIFDVSELDATNMYSVGVTWTFL